jgi:hypothetical protein
MSDIIHLLKQSGISFRQLGALDDSDQLVHIAASLGSSTSLRLMLSILTNEERCLADVARRSYRHYNGFDRFELFPASHLGYGARLHIWWLDETSSGEHIHTHPWDFASLIVAGSLTFEQYTEDGEGEEFFVHYYDRPVSRPNYVLRPAGWVRLKKTFEASLVRNSSYVARRPFVHRVNKMPGITTATLMVHGAEIDYPTRIYVKQPLDGIDNATFPVKRFTPQQVLERLQQLVRVLDEN